MQTTRRGFLKGTAAGTVAAATLGGAGNVINGLYACGELTGGLHGNYRVDGSALSDGFTFGHVAGRVAAESARA